MRELTSSQSSSSHQSSPTGPPSPPSSSDTPQMRQAEIRQMLPGLQKLPIGFASTTSSTTPAIFSALAIFQETLEWTPGAYNRGLRQRTFSVVLRDDRDVCNYTATKRPDKDFIFASGNF
jgi:hypothetical protein